MGTPLGSGLLGATTFCARQHGADECDAKGLPLTPNSTIIIGRFERLKELYHPNLPVYLDARKLKNERIAVVSEWYDDCLESYIRSTRYSSASSLSQLAKQMVSALSYLEEQGITHRGLSLDNILLNPKGDIKLHNYGLYYMSGEGDGVDFPIGSPRYMAPEVIIAGPEARGTRSSNKVDVWSMGIVLLQIFMESLIYPELFMRNAVVTLFKRIVLLMQNYQDMLGTSEEVLIGKLHFRSALIQLAKSINPLVTLLEVHNCSEKEMDEDLKLFLTACLTPLPSKRPTAKSLLKHPFILKHSGPDTSHYRSPTTSVTTLYPFLPNPFTSLIRCDSLGIQTFHPQPPQEVSQGVVSSQESHPPNHLNERSFQEVYYLWSLAGGDLELELKKVGLILSKAPIFNMPSLLVNGGDTYGAPKDRVTLYDSTVVQLSQKQLRKRLESMTTEDYYPLLETIGEKQSSPGRSCFHESSKLPLTIREKDVEYQFYRTIIFSRLLESYPHSRNHIIAEAEVDVCPLLRGQIWAAILGVKGDIAWQYSSIDKEDSETSTDRQIDVDIPRCHQYDSLLSSRMGHKKFKRILKAWVVSHPKLVYWQGLDSLCAPILSLNFNNEGLVYACMSAFIDKFLHNFFLKDNSPVMQEYLGVFSQLISFHDPELYNHLDSVAFSPELYAIPWFLTMFTHILPLDKIYHLWDTMLLGNCSFPLFVGLAILQQLREDLLSYGFNECILMFSDMPVIDIQMCIQTAVKLYQTTPISCYVRNHQHTPVQPTDIPTEADRQPLSLVTLKSESCPHISAHDLITLGKLEPSYGVSLNRDVVTRTDSHLLYKKPSPSSKSGKKQRPKAVVVDIRSNEEFRLGHVPHSLSIPYDSAFQPDGSLTLSQASATLSSVPRGRVVIIVGNKGETSPIFGRQLVRLNLSRVCVLHGGAGLLRTLGVLSSIQDDI